MQIRTVKDLLENPKKPFEIADSERGGIGAVAGTEETGGRCNVSARSANLPARFLQRNQLA